MGHSYGPALIEQLRDPDVAPPRRWARASVSAAAATGLGLAGHLLAGGDATIVGAVLAFVTVVLPSWLLAGRERGWVAIAGVQIAAQQVLHPLLVAASGAPEPTAMPHDLMFFLHVFGALAVAVWLRLGERRLWVAARRLVAHLALWSRRLLAVPLARTVHVSMGRPCTQVWLRASAPLRHVLSRRGPPLPA